MAEWWPHVGRAQVVYIQPVVYIGLLPETVCMPYSGLIVAVYRPCTLYRPYTSGQCPSSGRS